MLYHMNNDDNKKHFKVILNERSKPEFQEGFVEFLDDAHNTLRVRPTIQYQHIALPFCYCIREHQIVFVLSLLGPLSVTQYL